MHKIGVLLSGCGVMDGSEIHEATITLLAIDKEGMEAVCIASDINQAQVFNHFTNKVENEKRNVLVESARIARGKIKNLKNLDTGEIDALIIPGGYGAALNLSSFGKEAEKAKVLEEVEKLLIKLHSQRKPIGAICIAPNIIAKVFGNKNVELTIGNDPSTISKLEKMGAKHIAKKVNEVVIDNENLIVTTPAYMLAKSIKEVEQGISKLVAAIKELIKTQRPEMLALNSKNN